MARGAILLLSVTAAFACTVPTAGKPFQIFSLPSPPVFTAQRPSPEEEALASEEAQRRAVAAADARAEAEADRTSRELLCATVGLDRGTLATGAEAARVEAAVAAFEAAAACKLQGSALLGALASAGAWKLVYTSSLVPPAAAQPDGGDGGGLLMPGGGGLIVGGDDERLLMLAKVLSLPSGLGVGVGRIAQRVWVSGEEARLEDRVSLRFPAPWPLPRLEVTATLYSSLQPSVGAAPGRLVSALEEIEIEPRGPRGPRLRLPAPRRALREALGAEQLPAPFSTLPPAQSLARFEADAGELTISALHLTGSGGAVRVLRSALGEVRVFVGEGGALSAGGAEGADEADLFAEEFWVEGVSDW